MRVSEADATSPPAPAPQSAAARRVDPALAVVIAATVVGVALRVAFATQSLNADELSTRWIVSTNGLWGVVSMVHTDAEITPPLYFVLAWLTTRVDLTPELLRAPSLVAGTLCIPLVFALGRRTVGRRAALVATVLTALSPFMTFYSAEARAYGVVMLLTLLSTLALLVAAEGGRTRWWVAYAVFACGAVYTHYTSVFALAGQLGWLLWAYPGARRPALVASAAAALGFVPWISGLQGDLGSQTTKILSALQPFDAHSTVVSLSHWVIGYPYASPGAGLRDLPGLTALVLLALGLALAAAGVLADHRRALGALRSRGFVLVLVLALSLPVGEALASALGSNILGTRNLAASWPALALCLGALLAAPRPRAAAVAAALAVAAFAIAAVTLQRPAFQRPDYRAAAASIDRRAAPRDSVVDGANLSPIGVPGSLEVSFDRHHRVYSIGRAQARYDPFRIVAGPEPTPVVIRRAAAAARGGRIFVLLVAGLPQAQEAIDAIPARFQRVARRSWPGSTRLALVVYEDRVR